MVSRQSIYYGHYMTLYAFAPMSSVELTAYLCLRCRRSSLYTSGRFDGPEPFEQGRQGDQILDA